MGYTKQREKLKEEEITSEFQEKKESFIAPMQEGYVEIKEEIKQEIKEEINQGRSHT